MLLDLIRAQSPPRLRDHLLLALAKSVVFSISNLHFGPEVGVTAPKQDAPVVSAWQAEVRRMATDCRWFAAGAKCRPWCIRATRER